MMRAGPMRVENTRPEEGSAGEAAGGAIVRVTVPGRLQGRLTGGLSRSKIKL